METVLTAQPARQRQAIRELLGQRDFGLFLAGQLFSQIGDRCLLIAAFLLVTDLSPSPLALLIPAVSMALPQVIFGLLGGVVADRWDRKHLMIASDLLRAVMVLAVIFVRSSSQLWIVSLVAAGLATVGAFYYPARNAAIPGLVSNDLLLSANSLVQGGYLLSLIAGPVIAGLIVDLWGMGPAIVIDSLTYLGSAAATLAITLPKNSHATQRVVNRQEMWSDMKIGLQFIRRSRPLRRTLYVTAVATLGVGSIIILAIPHLRNNLDAGGLWYALAMSVLGLGAVIGGLIVTRLSRRLSTNVIIGGMLVITGLAIVAFAYAPTYAVVLASVMVLGLCVVVARGALDTITQTLAPDWVRGRVQAAVNLVVAAGTALAEGLAAFLGHFLGVRTVFCAAGALTVLSGIASVYALSEAARAIAGVASDGESP